MNKFNIIGDIAGRYTELQKLLTIMPPCEKIILVGDLVDRGPDSKKVVEWAMKGVHNGTPIITLKGNHEDMFIVMWDRDSVGHPSNGQIATLNSYGITNPADLPVTHISWMDKLPLFFQSEGLFVSHAPWIRNTLPDEDFLEHLNYQQEQAIIWNREEPKEIPGMFQVFGHNHQRQNYGNWAICIDDCSQNVLTGLTFPGKTIYQVQYEEN